MHCCSFVQCTFLWCDPPPPLAGRVGRHIMTAPLSNRHDKGVGISRGGGQHTPTTPQVLADQQ